jgi:hypothetical protein
MKTTTESFAAIEKAKKEISNSANISRLERKVLGENMILCHTLIQLENVLPQLEKYKGQKIRTLAGWSAKFKIELKEFKFYQPFNMSYRCYVSISGSSLWLNNDITIKQQEYAGGGCCVEYHKKSIFLGDLDKSGQILETVKGWQASGYSFELFEVSEVSKLLDKKTELEKQLSDLKRKLNVFSNY